MSSVLHLSDLHLLSGDAEQESILVSLLAALEAERARRGAPFDLVAITGDVFDTATLDAGRAVREFEALRKCIQSALGGTVPTIVVPGNHDRRRIGLFGPHRHGLLRALRDRMGPEVMVHGCDEPFLAAVAPREFHRQPFWVIAYDSSYLPSGYLSAGGVVRQEDLLHAAAIVGDDEPDWPVLFLLHHHLVPTPLTDLGPIDTHRVSPIAHAMLHRVLPVLVAHADREELTMTALGAGTALSTLHAMGRAVLVLHGHKHVASARKLEATESGQGDVLLVSAGSAGTAQRWSPNASGDAARLWPSFNVVQLDGDALTIETVSFRYKRRARDLAYRPLVWAERDGRRWRLAPIEGSPAPSGPELAENVSTFRLMPSHRFGGARWDYECERRVRRSGRAPRRYVETVDRVPGARLEMLRGGARRRSAIDLAIDGSTLFRVAGGALRTVDESVRVHGPGASPFGWLGLMNRYRAARARLVIEGLGARARTAFASATDLGTGQERSLTCERDIGGDRVIVEVPECAARTLLRVHWPLERGRS